MAWPPVTYDVISEPQKLTITELDSKCARGINEQLLETSGADVLSSKEKKLRKAPWTSNG